MARLNRIVEGLQIIAKYEDPNNHCADAEHDILYAGCDQALVSKWSDRERMLELGWHVADNDRWAILT